MKKIIQILQKLGILSVTKGDFLTGEYKPYSKDGENISEKNVLVQRIKLLLIFLVALFIIFFIIGIFSGSDKEKVGTETRNSNGTETITYSISSKKGDIGGRAYTRISNENKRTFITVIYNLEIETSLNQKLVCDKTLFPTESECPSMNFYNYTATIGDFYARIDPVFCADGFQPTTNLTDTNYGPYIDCWYGKRGPLETNKFYTGIYATYDSMDEFLENNSLVIIDSAPYTTRETVTQNNQGQSSESVDWDKAVAEGNRVFESDIVFEEQEK